MGQRDDNVGRPQDFDKGDAQGDDAENDVVADIVGGEDYIKGRYEDKTKTEAEEAKANEKHDSDHSLKGWGFTA